MHRSFRKHLCHIIGWHVLTISTTENAIIPRATTEAVGTCPLHEFKFVRLLNQIYFPLL